MSRILILVASSLLSGCVAGEQSITAIDQATTTANGVSPNGVSPNGVSPNGVSPNGITLNGVSPNGVSPNGTAIGIAVTGAPLAGAGIVGSTWPGHVSNGTDVSLRIDAAMQGTGANADVWSYRFSVLAEGIWRPLCLDSADNEIFADSVPGTWNYAQGVAGGGSYHPEASGFTLACRGSAIAKCVELGYKPWTGNEDELATCVRALRGDYCGDGTPYTVNGTLVNIYDAAGIQPDGVAWDAEAEWTPDGATCVSKKKETRFTQVGQVKPSCYPRTLKNKNWCGDGFTHGAAIITELRPL
jgi:hypothetical protein